MTNEPIKPGYYWADFRGEKQIIEVHNREPSDIFFLAVGSDEQFNVSHPQLFEIIAPALPPDQWPTKETVHELVKARPYNGTDFAFVEGFMACYKLFTGKDLQ